MRVLAKIHVDTQLGNKVIKDNQMGRVIGQFAERAKPEVMYFGIENGVRTAYAVFDMKDSSELPPLFEPLFMEIGASWDVTPVMNQEELQRGLGKLAEGK